MNKLYCILLFSVVVCFPLKGQKIIPTPADLYSDANEFMYSGDYYDALLLLLSLDERGYKTANIHYLIGECYLNIQGQKTKAIPFLKDAVENISNNFSGATLEEEYAPNKSLLYLGIAYRLNYDFDNALKCFNDYIRSLDETDKDNKRLAEFHIERCNHARVLIGSPARFAADTLDNTINSSLSNLNAVVSPDEKVLYYVHQMKFYDAVMRTINVNTLWQAPENLTPLIKSDGDHYVTGMSVDGAQIFLTCYDPYNTGELFTARFESGQWTEMQKMNSNINTRFNETHATLSPDNKVLYFTSDRKGGYGGTDIYKSVINENGEWDIPVNLGPLVNSPFNEETPFIAPDGKKLFFSSQGHYNMGGYDIFYSSLGSNGNWLPPVNIGYPLNTTDDDLFFFPLDTGNIAYQARYGAYASQTDIVRYTISEFGNPARFMVNGKIDLKADTGYNPSLINVAFIDKRNDDTLVVKNLNDDGSFRQNLSGGAYLLDFSNSTGRLYTKEMVIPSYFPHNNLIFHETITVPSFRNYDTIYLKPVRFGFDDSRLNEDYIPEIDRLTALMFKYPGIRLSLNGYTDDIGSEAYNMKLSLQRAGRVKDYIMKASDTSGRIDVKAFGESNPVAENQKAGGADYPEGRQFNRRVEIEIINAPDTLIIVEVKDIPETVLVK